MSSEATPRLVVTRAKGNVVYELDGKPAFSVYQSFAEKRGVQLSRDNAGAFLIAHDPVLGRTHFIGVTTYDEVHDHECTWNVDNSLVCDPLTTGPATEDLWFDFHDANHWSFTSDTTLPGGALIHFVAHGTRTTPVSN